MEAMWTPLFSFMVFSVIFALGDVVANKTKAIISAMIVGCVLFLVGYLTGFIPTNAVESTGLPTITSNFGIALILIHMGTSMNIDELLREWKTVVVALAGLVGLGVMALTVCVMLFGREWAILGSAPISGGLIATIIASDAANELGRGDLAAYVTLLCAFQFFAGLPVASFMLKKEARRILSNGELSVNTEGEKARKLNICVIKSWPRSMQSHTFLIAKMALVAVLSVWLSNLTKFGGTTQLINQNIMFLLMGVLFCELGFLEKNILAKAGAANFLMLALLSIFPGNFKSVNIPMLLSMIWPVVGMLVLCSVGIVLLSALVGRLLKVSMPMSAAIGVCCLIGYPGTQIITDEVITALDLSPEDSELMRSKLMPKMIVSGFTSVTIASVAFASVIVPMVFS